MQESEQFLVDQARFQGSLTELAHALRTQTLAPADVDLYLLVRAYLDYFGRHAAADLELATEALPRVAQVIELKTRLLLPKPPREEHGDEVDDVSAALEAVALLEELEEAILFLRRRREERRIVVPAVARPPDYPRRERPLRVTPRDLARLAGRYRVGGYFELALERLTLAGVARRVLSALRRAGRAPLFDLLDARDWPTRTVGLAALLELLREGRVTAEQAEPYGPIVVAGATQGVPTGGADDDPAPAEPEDDWAGPARSQAPARVGAGG